MTIKTLRKYGELRRIFRGRGVMRLSDGSDVHASFWLGQFTDTKLLVCADVKCAIVKFYSSRLKAVSLQGTLTDGRGMSATELQIRECTGAFFAKTTRLVISAGYWTISGPKLDDEASMVFELVNFRYDGTEVDENGSSRSLMTLVLGDRQVQLRPIADYAQVVATLRARRGVQVTCTATTTISSQSEINDVESVIDTLCDIMSVARGTLVSWTSYDVFISGEIPYSQYRSSVTRRLAGIELIDDNDPNNTKRFLEEGFRKSKELCSDFHIREIAHDFIETRDGTFIENRSLRIAVLVEYLSNIYAHHDKKAGHFFFDPEVFNAGWDIFESNVKSALGNELNQKKRKYLSLMLRNMEGLLNRRPLKFKIQRLAKWLGIEFLDSEIDRFVETRDLLAHEGRFPDDGSPEEHYLRMQHFLDRIILRLFGYKGSYYDFEHGEIRHIQ